MDNAAAPAKRLALFIAAHLALAGCGGSGGSSSGSSATTVNPPVGGANTFLYVASADANGLAVPGVVYEYAINLDGTIGPGSSPSIPAGVTPTAMGVFANIVWVANLGDASISQYSVSSRLENSSQENGVLVPLSPAAVKIEGPYTQAGAYFISVAVVGHPSSTGTGIVLYVVATPPPAGPGSPQSPVFIAQYSVAPDGALTPLPTPYITLPVTTAGPLTIGPGTYAYLPAGGTVYQLAFAADGSLSLVGPVAIAGSAQAVNLPLPQLAYVLSSCADSSCDGQLAAYQVGADGALSTTAGSITLGPGIVPRQLLVDYGSPTYSVAWLLANRSSGGTTTSYLYQYSVDSSSFLLAPVPEATATIQGQALEMSDGWVLTDEGAGGAPQGEVVHYRSSSTGLVAEGSATVPGRPTAQVIVPLPVY
jgi:hypothetical protein